MRRIRTLLLLALPLLFTSAAAGQNVPPAPHAPSVGEKAPEFTLPDADGKPVKLSGLLAAPGTPRSGPALLLIVFRGYW